MTEQATAPAWPRGACCCLANLRELAGPDHGIVELPIELFSSSPDRRFDVEDPAQRQWLYEVVVRDSRRREHLIRYLNRELLLKDWPQLFLPRSVRARWEHQHPQLGSTRLAA